MNDAVEVEISRLLLGTSLAMRQLRSRVLRVASSGLPVLIQGPTGSGKELVARAIHCASGRSGPFVAFNVCAIADSMFEDALFGHTRGAFTGAVTDRHGYLAEAHRGTLFLDEVSGLGLGAQAKLLRAVETGAFRPVGARRDETSDFRIVAATNEPLRALVEERRFREDLHYRLSVCVIDVPPLAVRREDIAILARHFAEQARPGRCPAITECAVDALQSYAWPGNVRELRHVIECVVILSQGDVIQRADIAESLPFPNHTGAAAHGQRLARRQLVQVLEETGWNIQAAARVLGVHRATIYRRLKRSALLPPSSPESRPDVSRDALPVLPLPAR